MSVHRLCPRCGKVVRVRVRDGAYGVHRKGAYYNCTASGLTPDEVRQGMTALGKRTAEYLATKAQEQTPPIEGDQVT
ncbi:hypothetical protein OIA45_48930 (plasmid) [Streptomyces chartreusis]|uniref:hypothetical protein n=1 Tax=Streptomyces chartreusis TaxID=1969 RepID=UPI0037DD51B5|nr:hypothetical protein OIA45_48930 [Streptomyces chartreusis]